MARYVLGPKIKTSFDDFYNVWKHIEDYVSYDEIAAKVDEAVAYCKRFSNLRCGYGWSAGKDSIALQVIMEKAGVYRSVMCTCPEESPIFMQWVLENKPTECFIHSDKTITKEFLLKHQDRFWQQSNASWWYKFVPWNGLRELQRRYDLDVLFLGRRTNDNNYSKKAFRSKLVDCMQVSPMIDWRHEDVLACVHYFKNDNLPPLYSIPCIGMPEPIFWFERKGRWPEVAKLHPELIPGLAKYFPEARKYLK